MRLLRNTDLYGEYYGVNPDNPLSELNEEDKEKALEYISLLVDSGKYAPEKATIIPFTRMIKLFDILRLSKYLDVAVEELFVLDEEK